VKGRSLGRRMLEQATPRGAGDSSATYSFHSRLTLPVILLAECTTIHRLPIPRQFGPQFISRDCGSAHAVSDSGVLGRHINWDRHSAIPAFAWTEDYPTRNLAQDSRKTRGLQIAAKLCSFFLGLSRRITSLRMRTEHKLLL
jgi:hypothetical protein